MRNIIRDLKGISKLYYDKEKQYINEAEELKSNKNKNKPDLASNNDDTIFKAENNAAIMNSCRIACNECVNYLRDGICPERIELWQIAGIIAMLEAVDGEEPPVGLPEAIKGVLLIKN